MWGDMHRNITEKEKGSISYMGKNHINIDIFINM